MVAWRNGALASIHQVLYEHCSFVHSILKVFCFFLIMYNFLHKRKYGSETLLLMRSSSQKKWQYIGFLTNDCGDDSTLEHNSERSLTRYFPQHLKFFFVGIGPLVFSEKLIRDSLTLG